MARLIAGTSTATFTRICTSAYDYAGMDLELLTELQNIKQEAAVSKVTRISVAQVEVLAAINNNDLESGYYVRGIGLYAKDTDDNEILYGISAESEHPDYMPAFEGKTVSGISYKLNTKVDNSEQVSIEVLPAAVPTVEQVETIRVTIDTHLKENVCSEKGVHGFRFFQSMPQVYKEESQTWIDTNAAAGNTARTITKAIYQERAAAYRADNTYIDPDSGLPFAETLYYITDDYQDLERQAENIHYNDTYALGSTSLQGIIDIIAGRVTDQLLSRQDVVDTLTGTAPDLPASARTVKVLADRTDNMRLTADVRVYVDAVNGSDEAGDGTRANPWASIQKAVDMCPYTGSYMQRYNVCIANGIYGTAYIRGKQIYLHSLEDNPDVTINGTLGAQDCGRLYLYLPINVNTDKNNHGVYASDGYIYTGLPLSIIGAQSDVYSGLYVGNNGKVFINSSLLVNDCKRAVTVQQISSLTITGKITGTNNTTGLTANVGGTISYATPPASTFAATLYSTAHGGRIYTGSQ